MPIPDYETLMLPLARLTTEHNIGVRRRRILEIKEVDLNDFQADELG